MKKPNEKTQISAIKIKNGYFISDKPSGGTYNYISVRNLYFDGQLPEDTHDNSWVFIPNEPTKVEKLVSGKYINERYELKDSDLESDNIPLVLPHSEVVDCNCSYCCDCEWKEDYAHLYSLYEFKRDKEEDTFEDVLYEFTVIIEANVDKEMPKFEYPVQRGQWKSDGFTICTNNDVQHQVIDSIIWPSVVLKDKPSKLSSKDTYDIIRKHVQDNIYPKAAYIDSDHRFCFSVCKKIPDVNGKFEKDWLNCRSGRKIQVFEMTYHGENYRDYTPIDGFEGENHEDLKKNIDEYLENLMNMINLPLIDCPHCEGRGVIQQEIEND